MLETLGSIGALVLAVAAIVFYIIILISPLLILRKLSQINKQLTVANSYLAEIRASGTQPR